jgi:hypothetical protein
MTVIIPERLGDVDQAAAAASGVGAEVEGEIREFVRRDSGFWRRPRPAAETTEPSSDTANSLIQRISGASIEEIDRAIVELQSMRETLKREGERVQRELTSYATTTQSALSSVKSITDSLSQWKQPAPAAKQRNEAVG